MRDTLQLVTMFSFYLNLSAGIFGLALLLILAVHASAQASGSLDSSFGNGGKLITRVGTPTNINRFARAYATAVQSDGKVLVAGEARNFGYDFALVRYNTDGSLDTSFDGDGKLITDFGTNAGPSAIVIQSNGKIVAAS